MPVEVAAKAVDPFYTTRTTRNVGLGLALLREAARAAGGGLAIQSAQGGGTAVSARFQHSHVDRAPVGDLEGTLMALIAGSPGIDVRFVHAVGSQKWSLSSQELAGRVAGGSLQSPDGLAQQREAVRRGEASVTAGSGR